MAKYIVVRVNGDNRDTHAASYTGFSIGEVVELANPDPNDMVEWTYVDSFDPGDARLIPMRREQSGEITIWQEYKRKSVRRMS